jgi:hypothetical protein
MPPPPARGLASDMLRLAPDISSWLPPVVSKRWMLLHGLSWGPDIARPGRPLGDFVVMFRL